MSDKDTNLPAKKRKVTKNVEEQLAIVKFYLREITQKEFEVLYPREHLKVDENNHD